MVPIPRKASRPVGICGFHSEVQSEIQVALMGRVWPEFSSAGSRGDWLHGQGQTQECTLKVLQIMPWALKGGASTATPLITSLTHAQPVPNRCTQESGPQAHLIHRSASAPLYRPLTIPSARSTIGMTATVILARVADSVMCAVIVRKSTRSLSAGNHCQGSESEVLLDHVSRTASYGHAHLCISIITCMCLVAYCYHQLSSLTPHTTNHPPHSLTSSIIHLIIQFRPKCLIITWVWGT